MTPAAVNSSSDLCCSSLSDLSQAGHDYEHDLLIASKYGMLGSVDVNSGDPMVGWDTDQFAMDIKKTTLAMMIIVGQGGVAPGGLNFDAKIRRESTDLEDFFIGHIGGMDAFARGLRAAAAIVEDGTLPGMVNERYSSWESPLGKKIEAGEAKLQDVIASCGDEPPMMSAQQEKYEVVFGRYTGC